MMELCGMRSTPLLLSLPGLLTLGVVAPERVLSHRRGRDVMVIVAGNGHNTSLNPGRDRLHFTWHNTLGKGMNPIILLPAMGK